MTARMFEILGVENNLGWNSDADFTVGDEVAVSPDIVIREPGWSLYSLDLEKALAWFVQLPYGTDLSNSVFAFRDQRRLARRLLQIALDEAVTLSQQVAPPERVIFGFSIGRCGSTLVSHVLNTCPQVLGAFGACRLPTFDHDKLQR